MRGIKKLLERVAAETDVKWLRWKAHDLHMASDYAALDDNTREWNQLCLAEHVCLERVNELEVSREHA